MVGRDHSHPAECIMYRTYLKIADCCRSDINVESFGSRTSSGNASGIIFPRRILPMGVLGANRFRRVVCSKRYCGFNADAQWHMLPQSYPNYKTVHRRFQTWCRDEVLRRVLTDVERRAE